MLNFAKNLAKQAGQIPKKYWNKIKTYTYKGARDPLTIADVKTNTFIVKQIRKKYPEHSILAEESSRTINPGAPYQWIIDPIDGTEAYSHGLPYFGVSIALYKENKPVLGVIYDPLIDELFWAQTGQGAYLNGQKINVSKTSKLDKAVMFMGFPRQRKGKQGRKIMKNFRYYYARLENIFSNTCAVLALSYVAAGRLDIYCEYILNPWDFAAGVIIVEEAGGQVTTPAGNPWTIKDKRIVATNGKIHQKFIKQLIK